MWKKAISTDARTLPVPFSQTCVLKANRKCVHPHKWETTDSGRKHKEPHEASSVQAVSYLYNSFKHVSQRQEGDEHIVLSRKDHFLQMKGMGDRKERNTDRKTTRKS